MVLSETTPSEVFELIKDLNNKRSADTFELNNVILKTKSVRSYVTFSKNILISCNFLTYYNRLS